MIRGKVYDFCTVELLFSHTLFLKKKKKARETRERRLAAALSSLSVRN